ncbi:MAG: leucine-rich repeat domain-containing protein [Treponema sp.]|jgi:hypothetical protein|nr:leucine-rich repeat domain-containing protein [Treponema sp.]
MKRLTVALVLCAAAVWNIAAQQGDFEISGGVLAEYRGDAAEVRVPNGVTAIGERAFSYTGIRSVILPAGLTAIGEGAFSECESLSSITLPAGLTAIGEYVFDDCYNLESITLLSPKPPMLEDDLGLADETVIYVPAAALSAYRTAEEWEYYTDRIQAVKE